MRETDEGITDAVERLRKEFANATRGTLILWRDIESVMGRHRNDRGGWTIVRKFRKWLRRERRIVTLPMTDTGLRLLTDTEAAREIPVLRQRRSRRQIARGLAEMRAIDPTRLSHHERGALVVQQRNMVEERRAADRSLRGIAAFLRRPETPPRVIPTPQVNSKPKSMTPIGSGTPVIRPRL